MCGVVAKGTVTCRETGRSSPHRLSVVAESRPRSTGATAEMTTGHLLTSTWDWEPSVLAGCAALAAGYVVVARPLRVRALSLPAGGPPPLLGLCFPPGTPWGTYPFHPPTPP